MGSSTIGFKQELNNPPPKLLSKGSSSKGSSLVVVSKPPDWTKEEVEALLKGIKTYGTDWKFLMEDESIRECFHFSRTESSLRSKWSKIMRFPGFDIETVDIQQAAMQFSTNFQRFTSIPMVAPKNYEKKGGESTAKLSGTKRRSSEGVLRSPVLTSSKPQKPVEKEKPARKKRRVISFDHVERILQHRFVDVRAHHLAIA
jgi:hypothetical protein